jgi:hypothetical protein
MMGTIVVTAIPPYPTPVGFLPDLSKDIGWGPARSVVVTAAFPRISSRLKPVASTIMGL